MFIYLEAEVVLASSNFPLSFEIRANKFVYFNKVRRVLINCSKQPNFFI